MSAGFVYVLLNPSFPDQVKIGLTTGRPEARAKELRATGVPTPFVLVYDELVSDCREVERVLHERFAGYRVSSDREFFRIPVREAVRALQEVAAQHQLDSSPDRVSIYEPLNTKYPGYLPPDIKEVEIVQYEGVCFIQVTRRMYQDEVNVIIHREDLSFIVSGDGPMFPPTDPITENAQRFVRDLDDYSIIMTLDLFTEEASRRIADEWERSGG